MGAAAGEESQATPSYLRAWKLDLAAACLLRSVVEDRDPVLSWPSGASGTGQGPGVAGNGGSTSGTPQAQGLEKERPAWLDKAERQLAHLLQVRDSVLVSAPIPSRA